MHLIIAHIDPQAWVNGHAVSVEAPGDQTWDATEAFFDPELSEEYRTSLAKEIVRSGWVVDSWDWFQRDSSAPDWVAGWQGPFTITLRFSESDI